MKLKRILALLLSLALVVALAACGGDPAPDADNSPAADSSAPAVSPSPDDGYVSMANAYARQLAGLDKDTVLFTVNGRPVTAEYYLYWLTYDCYYWDYMNRTYYGTALDFDSMATEELTVAQYLLEDSKNFAAYYMVMEEQAAAADCGVTEEQAASWEEQKAEYIAQNGQEAFDLLMAQWGTSTEAFDVLNTYTNVYANLMEEKVGDPSEADLDAYIEANEIYAAKHILILNAKEAEDGSVVLATGGAITNEDGTPYTGTVEEYNADALARVQDIAARLATAEDPAALFDTLMAEHSEDTGLAAYPDGYTFGPGEMVTEFEEGTKAIAYGAISEIVESPYGYHIILRLRPDVEDDYRTVKMDALLEQWILEAEIVTTEAFDAIDVKTIYNNYLTYQSSLVPSDSQTSELPEGTEGE